MFGRDSPARPSMRDQIAAKRAEYQNSPAAAAKRLAAASNASSSASSHGYGSPTPKRNTGFTNNNNITGAGDDEKLADKTVTGEVKKAVRSGKLDLCSLSLPSIPIEVYTTLLGLPEEELSNPPTNTKSNVEQSDIPSKSKLNVNSTPPKGLSRDDEKELVFGGKAAKKHNEWIEPEELTSFRISENKLNRIEREIGMFGALERLDLSRNQLKELPDSIADLLRLTSLDLSENSFSSIPPQILVLPALQVLDISHNNIHELSFDNPIGPSEDGLSYGIGFFTTTFDRQAQMKMKKPIFPVLRSFNLGFNKLSIPGLRKLCETKFENMRVLNLENNSLQGILDFNEFGLNKSSMPILVSLILSRNTNLRGTNGELSELTKLDLSGCNLRESTPQPQLSSNDVSSESQAPQPSEIDAADSSNLVKNGISSKPIPNSDFTLVYRTLPAATFDSEPLPVDFDIYLPSTTSNPPKNKNGHPLVIWFHGGGLLQGNKENLPPHLRRLPSVPLGEDGENCVVISPNYRLSPQTPILEILDDITHFITYIKTKLNDRLKKEKKVDYDLVDSSRICLSGSSAGGYLALITGLDVDKSLTDEEVGGYRGLPDKKGIKCLAPFQPITDLTDSFWSTETDPVPWMKFSVPHSDAKPHLNTKSAPICSAVSGGPRSILYPYMLQHGLFPNLLFQNQKSIGYGLDAFRPSPLSLSIPNRIELSKSKNENLEHIPIYFNYGTIDDKVQPMDKTLKVFKSLISNGKNANFTEDRIEGGDHMYDEDPEVECETFREWLGKNLI
ncbi:uncharacterized protein L201_000943 [Kwoniella dendrophila CBS 6074]|uniref:BD-FAE-like domain-containing protein n=1 Tax=Kwoniella dendrophila CBS 6074 TaxID=1295534 RepID=A0AAX4JKZ7_9TREE